MQQIQLKPALDVRSRTKVLYDVVDELTRVFLVRDQETVSGILRRGVFERQYLSAVFIYLLDGQGKRVAEIKMEIDWGLHRIRVKDGRNEFNIDSSRSIHEQVSEVFPVIRRHMENLKKALMVSKSEVWFSYTREIRENPNRYAEARRYVGTEDGTPPTWSDKAGIDDVYIEFVSEMLDELRLTIQHRRQ